jgi:hypothetical protein
MKLARRVSALTIALLLSGCGGGGGSAPAPHAVATSTSAAAGATPIATGKLTVKYPASFHTARLLSKAKFTSRSAGIRAAGKLRPAYVNGSSGFFLDVWVDGVHVVAPSSGNILNTSDGTQTFSIPLFSTQAHQLVAIETDTGLSEGNILAIGELDIPANSFNAGDAPVFGLTMLMNAVGIGITTDPSNGSDATACISGTDCSGETENYFQYTSSDFSICPSGTTPSLYVFTTDPLGGFVAQGGAGIGVPNLTSWNSLPVNGGSTLASSAGLVYGYTITYNNAGGALIMNLSATNPAIAIYNDIENSYGPHLYPGIAALVAANSTVSNLINNSIGAFYTDAYNNGLFTMSIEVDASCEE